MKKTFMLLSMSMIVFGLTILLSGTVYATLITRGMGEIVSGGSGSYKLIYDDYLNITWLDYTNRLGGSNSWGDQSYWASGLEVNFNGQTFDDWCLPIADESNVVNSEMGHLYWDSLGNNGVGLQNTGPFDNLQAWSFWSGTRAFPYGEDEPTRFYWAFRFTSGTQYGEYVHDDHVALAVHPGDVAVSVPEPSTMLLLGSGLVGLAGLRRKIKK